MVGAPDSGKTNYLGRLWGALDGKKASLRATQQPDDIRYVLAAFRCLLEGRFAPRTDMNVDVEGNACSIQIAWARGEETAHASLFVPDVSGELWKDLVQTNRLLEVWLRRARRSIGALLFVRVGSGLHVPSLDWVTARECLELGGRDGEPEIPTDVQLCELLRFLELFLGKDANAAKARVAVLVAAWDIVDQERAREGPASYLRSEFPLFAGRLADVSTLDVEVFGLSVVGGDLGDGAFKDRFLSGSAHDFGYVVTESGRKSDDVTIPVRWLLDDKSAR